jgi:hypothetical protein
MQTMTSHPLTFGNKAHTYPFFSMKKNTPSFTLKKYSYRQHSYLMQVINAFGMKVLSHIITFKFKYYTFTNLLSILLFHSFNASLVFQIVIMQYPKVSNT